MDLDSYEVGLTEDSTGYTTHSNLSTLNTIQPFKSYQNDWSATRCVLSGVVKDGMYSHYTDPTPRAIPQQVASVVPDILLTTVFTSHLGRHDGSLEVLRPYSCCPVANRHEVFVLGGVPLDAVDRAVVLARTHIKHANTVVLLPVSKIDLTRHQVWAMRADSRGVTDMSEG